MPKYAILVLFIFAAFNVNAQQVFFLSQQGESVPVLPIDTAWCRQKGITKIVTKTYERLDTHKLGKRRATHTFLFYKGVPYQIAEHNPYINEIEDSFEIVAPECIAANCWQAKTTFDSIANAKTRLYFDKSKYLIYAKTYYAASNSPLQTLLVSGYAKYGYMVTNIQYNFSNNGLLLSIVLLDNKLPAKQLQYRMRYTYSNGQIVSIVDGDDFFDESITKITYYAGRKRVKP